MERVIGLLFSGFACKLYAAGFALWIASEVVSILLTATAGISAGLNR